MNRLALAVLLVAAFGMARADTGAYGSLQGMADSAAGDRGPDAGALPDDSPAAMKGAETRPAAEDMRGELRDAVADVPPARRPAAKAKPAAPAARPADPDGAVMAAPAAPRLWTRLYSRLMPDWRRVPSFKTVYDAAASTAPVLSPAPALMPPPDSEAVKAGERRGLAELMSASAVPDDAQ